MLYCPQAKLRFHDYAEDRLLDLERVVVRRLILLMRGGEKIGSRLGFPQIKINRNFFPVSIAGCGSAALSQQIIVCLISSDSDRLLTRFAVARK